MKKYKVAIVSTGPVLDSILSAIDLENIEISAVFGIWESMSDLSKKVFKEVFQPLDMLSVNCDNLGGGYFLVNFDLNSDTIIRRKLISRGIEKDKIIILQPFGSIPQFNYSYARQWQILKNSNLNIDFIVTGISYIKFGVDLLAMQPWRGVNLARNAQDLYYGYKMAEVCIKNLKIPLKFCLIGFAPYYFNHWVDKTKHSHFQMDYLSILDHNQMEYYGTERGKFLETIFMSKYKTWYNYYFKIYANQQLNLNDIDGSRQWHQEKFHITHVNYIGAVDEVGIYKRKIYPETIEQNKIILKNYIELCRQNDVVPIGLLLPFSTLGHKHYPKNSLQNFFDTLQPFLKDMNFINLWDLKLPDSCFEDITHLNIRGSVEVTKIIKEQVIKILSK